MDTDEILRLVDAVAARKISELSIDKEGVSLRIVGGAVPVPVTPVSVAAAPVAVAAAAVTSTSNQPLLTIPLTIPTTP